MNRGTKEGTREEKNLVKLLNSNKKDKLWSVLQQKSTAEQLFAIHVTEHKYGKINGIKIKPKADAYLARGIVDNTYLKRRQYYLDEADVDRFKLEKIPYSGISIKRHDSAKYQILKMNPNTFRKIFGSFELGAGASIFRTKKQELSKNDIVLKGWSTNWDNFERFFSFIPDIKKLKDPNINSIERLSIAKQITSYAIKRIKEIIDSNSNIVHFIFQGIGNFNEPYTATWFYERGELKKASKIPYVVTTGSGRSHGDFTVVIKPK